jgi:hypothetical protein
MVAWSEDVACRGGHRVRASAITHAPQVSAKEAAPLQGDPMPATSRDPVLFPRTSLAISLPTEAKHHDKKSMVGVKDEWIHESGPDEDWCLTLALHLPYIEQT